MLAYKSLPIHSIYIAPSPDDNYVLTGITKTVLSDGNYGVFIAKLDTNSNIIWQKYFRSGLSSISVSFSLRMSIDCDNNGNIIVGTNTDVMGGLNALYIKLDPSGNLINSLLVDNIGTNTNCGIDILNDTVPYILTRTNLFPSSSYDLSINKLNGCFENCSLSGFNMQSETASLTPTDRSIVVYSTNYTEGSITVTTTSPVAVDSLLCIDSVTFPDCSINASFTSSDTIICQNDTIFFTNTSTGALTYNWLINGVSFSTSTNAYYIFNSNGTFTITLIADSSSCIDSDTLLIKVNPLPDITISSDSLICDEDTIQLFASGGQAYLWAPDTNISCTTCQNPLVFPASSTTYYVQVTDSNGCTNQDSTLISTSCCINGVPSPVADFSTDDSLYCHRDSVTFFNQSVASPSASYVWIFGDNAVPETFTGTNPPPVFFNESGAHKVILMVYDSCSNDSVSKNVLMFGLPNADAGNDTSICITDSILLGETPVSYRDYSWKTSDFLSDSLVGQPLSCPDSTIQYILTVTDEITGCTSKDTVLVMVYYPDPVTVSNDTSIELGETVQLKACCGINYTWWPNLYINNTTISNPVVKPPETITYYAEVFDSVCIIKDSVLINVYSRSIYVPNIITPNGDGINDKFIIEGIYETYSLSIYNRWGKHIYETDNYKNDWEAEGVNDGNYYYHIFTESKQEYKGWIQVLR